MPVSRRRKLLLIPIVVALLGVHGALFIAGGSWRTLAWVLLGVDAFSAWFVIAAVSESKKLERESKKDETPVA